MALRFKKVFGEDRIWSIPQQHRLKLLFKAFEEKTLKKGYDKASEEISLLERQADELNRALKISGHNLKTLKGNEPKYKRKSEVLEG